MTDISFVTNTIHWKTILKTLTPIPIMSVSSMYCYSFNISTDLYPTCLLRNTSGNWMECFTDRPYFLMCNQ